MRIYERILGQDLNLGVSTGQVQNPGGGVLNGHQISLTTFSIVGAEGSRFTFPWVPTPVQAGLSITDTFVVDGAALGDVVLPTIGADLMGLILSAYVESPNNVKIVLFNPTTVPVNILTGISVPLAILVFRVR